MLTLYRGKELISSLQERIQMLEGSLASSNIPLATSKPSQSSVQGSAPRLLRYESDSPKTGAPSSPTSSILKYTTTCYSGADLLSEGGIAEQLHDAKSLTMDHLDNGVFLADESPLGQAMNDLNGALTDLNDPKEMDVSDGQGEVLGQDETRNAVLGTSWATQDL